MDKVLSDVIVLRLFKGDRKKIRSYLKKFPNRFESESHFIRCAIIQFERQLDQVILHERFEKTLESMGKKVKR